MPLDTNLDNIKELATKRKDDFEVIDELSESTLVGTEINISIKISNEVMSI